MCRPVGCAKCGKTTWAGCGAHVDQVMSRVRPEDRCTCAKKSAGTSTGTSADVASRSLWDTIKNALGGR